MTTTNWIFAHVCYFILFIVDFPAYVVDIIGRARIYSQCTGFRYIYIFDHLN